MSGLSKVLVHLDKKNVHLLAVYIFMKIKPFLESVSLVFIYVLYNILLYFISIFLKSSFTSEVS